MNGAIPGVVFLLLFPAGSDREAVELPSAEEIAAKARAGMEEYVGKLATRLCGTVHDRSGPGRIRDGSGPKEGTLWDERKVTIVQNGRYGYWIEETNSFDGSPPVSLAMLYGPKVRASLRKGEDGQWSLTDYRAAEGRAEDCWPLTAWTGMGYLLEAAPIRERSKLLWSEGIRLQPVGWDKVDGRRVLRVAFENPGFSSHGERGEIWLDPGWMWAIVKGRTERLVHDGDEWHTMRTEFRLEYNESYAPYPVPKKHWGDWIVEGSTRNPEGWYEQIFELRVPEKPPADEEFTLARFGVANVAATPVKREAAPWLWIALVACIFAGLLWWLRSRMRGAGEVNHAGQGETEG